MKVTVNGKPLEVADNASLADFIAARKLEARSPMVELNGEIVGQDLWEKIVLAEGDRLELVSLVGGG
jgi:thiamine biosynthesis protein ThiS